MESKRRVSPEIKAEVAQLQANLAKLYASIGPMDDLDTVDDAVARVEQLRQEQDALNDWKESASRVLNDIDLQGVGKLLGFALGSDIAKQILPAIKSEREARERAEKALREMTLAIQALPLDSFGEEMSACDAADFVDNAGAFFTAMVLARRALASLKSSEGAK